VRDAFRLARKWEELSSGEARNSPGKTSGEPKTASAGEVLDSLWGEEQKSQETPREVGGKTNQVRNSVPGGCL
jgi:hypothetical protein